jgi:hypothetical protein
MNAAPGTPPMKPGDAGETVLAGVITGIANDIEERLSQLAIPSASTRLTHRILRHTFGNAGLQRRMRQQRPGFSCEFDLAEWARAMAWDKANLRRALGWLVEHHIIQVMTEPGSGRGRIAWNTSLGEWQGSQNRGGRRANAGAPPGNQNARERASVVNLIESPSERGHFDRFDGPETIKVTTKNNQSDHETRRKTIKVTMPTGPGARNEAARGQAQEYMNKREETIQTSPNGDARGASAGRATGEGVPVSIDSLPKKRAPRYSGEEQAYVRKLLDGVKGLIHWKGKLPTEGRERDAAHWFYRAHDGEPAPVEDVLACYAATKRETFWSDKFLGLQSLGRCYVEYRRDPDGYRAAREERASNGRPARYDTRATGTGQPGASRPPGAGTGAGGPKPPNPNANRGYEHLFT